MKPWIILFFIFFSTINVYAQDTNTQILNEIKNLRHDMNKRFEQVDKRFEQVDKRFEQVDKRFDFMQNILLILMGLIFASPFIAIYLKDRKQNENKTELDNIKGILFVLREIAQDDEKLSKALKAAKLL